MGKIRVKTLGDETQEKEQQKEARARRDAKKMQKEKSHIKGVGLKGGQQIKIVEGVELKPEIEAMLQGNATTNTETIKTKKSVSKKIKARVRSHRYQEAAKLIQKNKSYPITDALTLLKKTSTTAFDSTVETHINLNPESLPEGKMSLNGTVNLPHGTGKKRRVAIVDDEILKQIEAGKIDFDVLVTHPSFMSRLAKFARVLGPKGLMPNPKNGTISPTPEKRAKELEGGEMAWKTEPDHPVIHQVLGKVSFTEKQIQENLQALVKAIGITKILKLTISSTMGPGIKVDLTSF